MQKQMLYAWAAEICDRAATQLKNEDSRVELKSVWPAEHETARQLGGHANMMRGEPVLWLIGVHDGVEVCGIQQTTTKDPGAWYQVVGSNFDGQPPDMFSMFISWRDRQVCALLFETDSPPYVVKNPSGKGPFQLEVPWRDGTLTRSARKHELLKILAPLQRLPDLEIQEATLSATRSDDGAGRDALWQLWVRSYVTPPLQTGRVDFPFHKVKVDVWLNGEHDSLVSLDERVRLSPRSGYGETRVPPIIATTSEITISGPGRVELYASGHSPLMPSKPDGAKSQHLVGRLLPTHADIPCTFELDLSPANDFNGAMYGRWVFPAHRASEKITPDIVINLPERHVSPFADLPKPDDFW